MKKLFLLVILCLFATFCFSQEFLGIKPEGTKQEVIKKFVAKGFKLKKQDADPQVTSMEGTFKGVTYELNIVYTPITKKVWKFAVYLPEKISWTSLKSCYNEYLEILKSKYGEPEETFDYFDKPYYEGDGYEISAVLLDKCHYSSFWKSVAIYITKWKQVKISYENLELIELNDKEVQKMNKEIF